MDPIKIHQDLQNNQEDLESYMRDLRSWTEKIKKKDEELSSNAKVKEKTNPSQGCGDFKRPPPHVATTSSQSADAPRTKMPKKSDTSEEVIKLKEAGNECLKNQNYVGAIKHYSDAMELDSSYSILPANRGMAYLKINAFEKAEEDCSRAIALDPLYIKAYLRRGTARQELNKLQQARHDYEKVLDLEPHNRQAKTGLQGISTEEAKRTQLQTTQTMKDTPVSKEATPAAAAKPSHLRSKKPLKKIAVMEVRNEQQLRDFIEKGDVSQVNGNAGPAAGGTPQSSTEHKAVVKEASDETLGLKRLDIQTGNPSVPTTEKAPLKTVLPPAPRVSYEFIRDWKMLKADKDLRRKYLLQISPDNYRTIFRQSMEEATVMEILRMIESLPATEVGLHLRGISQVPRIDVLVMFMDTNDRALLCSLVSRCGADGQDMSTVKLRLGI